MKSLFQRTAHHVLNHFFVALPLAMASPALAQEKPASPPQTELANTIVPLNPKAFVKNMPIAQIDLVDFYKTLAQDMPDIVPYMDSSLLPKELQGDDDEDENYHMLSQILLSNLRIRRATLLQHLSEESFDDFKRSLSAYFLEKAGNIPADQRRITLQGIQNMSNDEIAEFIIRGSPHALPLFSAPNALQADSCMVILVDQPDVLIGRIMNDIGGQLPPGYDERPIIKRHEDTHCQDPRLITSVARNMDDSDPAGQLLQIKTETDADINAARTAPRPFIQTIADIRMMDAALNAVDNESEDIMLDGDTHNSSYILNSRLNKKYARSHAMLADLQQSTEAYVKFREVVGATVMSDECKSLIQSIYKFQDSADAEDHLYGILYIAARLTNFQDSNTRLIADGYIEAFNRINHLLGAGFADKVSKALNDMPVHKPAPTVPQQVPTVQAGAGARP